MTTNGYIDLADFKSGIRLNTANDDALLSSLIEGVSRAIDEKCGRRFYLVTGEIHYYAARLDDRYLSILTNPFLERKAWSKYPVDIYDCVNVTEVATNESGDRQTWTIWTPGLDYYLEPINGAVTFKPYNRVRADPINGRYWFPPWPEGVRITGTFGYAFDYDSTGTPVAPLPIREACRLQVNRLYKRKDAPFGTAKVGGLEAGLMAKAGAKIKVDDDIADLLVPFLFHQGETSKDWGII